MYARTLYILARKGIKASISFCSFAQYLYLCISAKRACKKQAPKTGI